MAATKKYPGTIEKRGDSYRLILKVDRVRHTFTLPGVSRREVEGFAKTKHAQLVDQARRRKLGLPDLLPLTGIGAAACRAAAPRGKDPVPAGFFDKYELDKVPDLAPSTQASYSAILARARQFFDRRYPGIQIDEVRKPHIREFLNWRAKQQFRPAADGGQRGKASKRTVQKERATIRAAFEYAVELELRESNPVHQVKTPKPDDRPPVILTNDQYEALLRECARDPMLDLYALTLGETGERCESEALWLRWADVDLEEGFLRVEHGTHGRRTKGKKGRWVPMTARLVARMRDHFAAFRMATYDGRRSEWVFHHVRTRRHAAGGDRITSLRHSFKSAAARAGLPDELHQHDLRHRSVTTLLAQGKDVVKVKEMHGHSSLSTTMGYTHLAREHLRDLVDPPPAPPVPARREA
jgi:site-specific recombinase XerD